MGQVAHDRYRPVVVGGDGRHDAGAGGEDDRGNVERIAHGCAVVEAQRPTGAGEQRVARGLVARELSPGHGVAADEAQCRLAGRVDHGLLHRRHVGDELTVALAELREHRCDVRYGNCDHDERAGTGRVAHVGDHLDAVDARGVARWSVGVDADHTKLRPEHVRERPADEAQPDDDDAVERRRTPPPLACGSRPEGRRAPPPLACGSRPRGSVLTGPDLSAGAARGAAGRDRRSRRRSRAGIRRAPRRPVRHSARRDTNRGS